MSAIQGIEGVISQLQTTAMSARAQESLPQPTISFAGQLHAALDRISDTQTAARTQAEKFTLGEPGVALNDVMTLSLIHICQRFEWFPDLPSTFATYSIRFGSMITSAYLKTRLSLSLFSEYRQGYRREIPV